MRILDTSQMKEAERRTIDEIGIPARVLMENAGRAVADVVEDCCGDQLPVRLTVLCGRGNNGGDGLVAARVLAERGFQITTVLVGRTADVAGDARANLDVLARLGHAIIEIADEGTWDQHRHQVLSADMAVDALHGTGLRGALTGVTASIVADLNAAAIRVIAVDLPSGLSADTAAGGTAVEAEITVTLGAPKLSLLLPPTDHLAGTIVVADIGIPQMVIDSIDGPRTDVLTREEMSLLVVPRAEDSHKGDYGRILIVAGSRGKTGAAVLAANAALRSGAGLVTVATPSSVAPVVAAMGAEFMTLELAETDGGTLAEEALETVLGFPADVLAIGPGLGTGPDVAAFVRGLVARSKVPMVLDADALNAFHGSAHLLGARDDLEIIITPHPGEMARLAGISIDDVQARRIDVAREFAVRHGLHVVLKGHRTVVASPDDRVSINLTGNPGMATGGTGDVLLGIVAAWLGQLADASAAGRLAVFLHGAAGDLAAERVGQTALVAGDITRHLGTAVQHLSSDVSGPEGLP